jgi:hypothetical protein
VLTPGIEYFRAADDDAALEFFEGRHTRDVPLVRADGLAPGGDLALFGSLLTGRAMDDLSAPESLRVLTTEDRDDFSLLLVALPDDLVGALAAATPHDLADVARRARMFSEYADLPTESILDALAPIATLARADAGGLYARLLVPRNWAPRPAPWWSRIGRIAPWAGLALATGLLVASLILRRPGSGPVGLPLIGALAAVCLGVLLARRVAARAHRVAKVRGGFVLLWVADRSVRVALRTAAETILGLPPIIPRGRVRGRWGYLSVDASGVTAYAGDDEPVRFPVESIVSLSLATPKAGSGGFGLRAPTPGIDFLLSTSDGRTAHWVAPLVDTSGHALKQPVAHGVVTQVAELLGRDHVEPERGASPR